MKKYIDAEKLTESINGLMLQASQAERLHLLTKEQEVCVISQLSRVLSFIDSLQQEQLEMDLEKALNSLDNAYFDLDGIAVMGATHYLTVNGLKDIARDFYELGFNARKEE